MPRPARIFTLNLGMQTVSMAEFHGLPSGGLKLAALKSITLLVDPAADATRNSQIESAVTELRALLKIPKKAKTHICLPSQTVFSRFVKLPGATAQDVESIIGFEAQQNVPFPIDEVVWDYQIMGDRRGETWDVSIVAIKADQLSEAVAAVGQGDIVPDQIDIAPTALFNSFRYNYPDAHGCSLLIDLGARTTNLVFSEEGRLFSRSIPIGGNTISSTIAKEFVLDITAAEKLKLEKASVGLGGAYAESENPTEARLAKVTRNTMTRLHAEIARSINFYRTTHGGSTPTRILLCGGGTGLPYMSEFFGEKLQAPVEYFNPLRNVLVDHGALPEDSSACSSGVGELVGCALRFLRDCPIEINLTPPAVQQAQRFAKRLPALSVAAVFLITAPALLWLNFNQTATGIQEKVAQQTNAVSRLEKLSQEISGAMAEREKLVSQAAPFLSIAAEKSLWASILEELATAIPQRHVWVTQIKPVEGVISASEPSAAPGSTAQTKSSPPATGHKAITAIEINGLYLDIPQNAEGAGVVDRFFENLKTSSVFAMGEDPSKIITRRTTPTGESWAYGYTLVLPLKQPLALP
ncbi:MAG: pilus assembly protein PilM [bacterium]